MKRENQFGLSPSPILLDARRHPRHKLETEIRVYPRNAAVVRGETVDISESGISAMLRVEVPVGEVVRLEFSLPFGDVEVHAMVRQRNAFRYGFQFVEASSAQDVIGRTCRQLAVEQATACR
jgi:PilZ domain